jgi:hypothetical protein
VRSLPKPTKSLCSPQPAYARIVNEHYFRLPFAEFIRRTVDELAAGGALQLREGMKSAPLLTSSDIAISFITPFT